MNIALACPTYKRADNLETPSYLPSINVVVRESEADEYRQKNPSVHFVVCPDGAQGNVARVRNWMLDHFLQDHDVLVTVDDDLQHIAMWENRERIQLTEDELFAFIEKYTIMAEDIGAFLWGLQVNDDPQSYRESCPFSTVSYIPSPFQAIRQGCHLRYDERLPLKEDYDYTLQHLQTYRVVFRVNHAFFRTRQVEQAGGCADMRTVEREADQLEMLRRKWGSKIVRTKDTGGFSNIAKSRRKHKTVDLNPTIRPPIKGV